ncbi:site-specific integrase [Psychroserpens sp.]|uniref:site-specific integrase n=1 Tax=Psychroserpens sp. TaxID=2020870 RepID=UPI002AA6AFBF|nr:site-specific integrase [Psychroserpens sp.]
MITKVTLRRKPISKNRHSLYLDFYPAIIVNGDNRTTRRQFLGLYIHDKPANPLEKQDNKQTLLLAEQIRQKRENELNKPEIYTAFELEQLKAKEKGELSFIGYYEQLMDRHQGKNYDVWLSALFYLKEFTGGKLKFNEVNERFCNDYRYYLLMAKSRRRGKRNLSQNTAHTYFNKFKATLKQAFKDNILSYDLNSKIPRIEEKETNRNFLTAEEVNRLANAECPNYLLKKASLFSILTGLRYSDIEKLKWKEVVKNSEGEYLIQFSQKKTEGREYHPISKQAYELLGDEKSPNETVFEGLKYSAHLNNQLLKWVMNAGIQKHITFHCFRHTYAVLQLEGETSIYTVSKMLGHKNVKTTQVYSKIVNESKRRTTDKIVIDFGDGGK